MPRVTSDTFRQGVKSHSIWKPQLGFAANFKRHSGVKSRQTLFDENGQARRIGVRSYEVRTSGPPHLSAQG